MRADLLLKVAFCLLNKLLDHLTADGACLLGGQVAVVAFVEVNANFAGGFHLEVMQCLLCACAHIGLIAAVRHFVISPLLKVYSHIM